MFNNVFFFFFSKIVLCMSYVEKYSRAGHATDDNTIQHMRLASWIIRLHTYAHNMQYLLVFHCNNGYTNAT
jgi:hypothetical protein